MPRRTVILLTLLAASAATTLGLSSPAQAAPLPHCETLVENAAGGGDFVRVPAHQVSPTSFTLTCVLEPGDHTFGVAALQDALNRCHHAGLTVDGSYGTLTRNAVGFLQAAAGIAVDGKYGPETRQSGAVRMPRFHSGGGFTGLCVEVG